MNLTRKIVAGAAVAAALTIGAAGPASGLEGLIGTPPPADERCKVPPLLFQVAAIVDVDSLEGCGFFEDPNFFENRKRQGSFNDNGLFTTIFG